PTLQSRILQGISAHRARASRYRLDEAERQVLPFVDYLRKAPGIEIIEVAGSFRRRCDTVGDADILVAAANGRPIADRFVAYPEVGRVLAQGTTRSSVLLQSGLQVDLRVVPRVSYGAALHYFTGSKAHNIAGRACRTSWSCATSAATSRCTPTPLTAPTVSKRWCAPAGTAATPTWRSPITRRRSGWPGGWRRQGSAARDAPSRSSRNEGRAS